MKLKALFAALALSLATSAFAADEKPTLKDSVDAEVKEAVEAAQAANKEAEEIGFAWRDSSKQIEEAIKAANEGENDKAKELAAMVMNAVEQGKKQAELAKDAGPRL